MQTEPLAWAETEPVPEIARPPLYRPLSVPHTHVAADWLGHHLKRTHRRPAPLPVPLSARISGRAMTFDISRILSDPNAVAELARALNSQLTAETRHPTPTVPVSPALLSRQFTSSAQDIGSLQTTGSLAPAVGDPSNTGPLSGLRAPSPVRFASQSPSPGQFYFFTYHGVYFMLLYYPVAPLPEPAMFYGVPMEVQSSNRGLGAVMAGTRRPRDDPAEDNPSPVSRSRVPTHILRMTARQKAVRLGLESEQMLEAEAFAEVEHLHVVEASSTHLHARSCPSPRCSST